MSIENVDFPLHKNQMFANYAIIVVLIMRMFTRSYMFSINCDFLLNRLIFVFNESIRILYFRQLQNTHFQVMHTRVFVYGMHVKLHHRLKCSCS